jgi:flagellar hook-basal body complex protein FliE
MTAAINAIAETAANVSKSALGIGGPGAALSTLSPTKTGAGAEVMPFSDLLTDAVNQVSGLESSARAAVNGLMTGSGVDVHQAMIATEKASMAFELALAVRNKAVQAYQSVMAMQF